jgi:hypothetical protein
MQSPLETSVQRLRSTRLVEEICAWTTEKPRYLRMILMDGLAPIAPRVRGSTDVEHKPVLPAPDQARRFPANPPREDRFVVYCGDAQRVSEGFAIALRAMGVEGHAGLPTTDQNREDE